MIFGARDATLAAKIPKRIAMAILWFVRSKATVCGPYLTQDLRERISAREFGSDAVIWWRGQRTWLPLSEWDERASAILESVHEQLQKKIWYVVTKEGEEGPLVQRELIEMLRGMPDLSRVRIRTEGSKKTKPVYEVQDIIEIIGADRRESERVPITGDISLLRKNRAPHWLNLKAAEISLGGIGIDGAHDLQNGDHFTASLRSEDLPDELQFDGEVVYVSPKGMAGIRFVNLSLEATAAIHDYSQKFVSSRKPSVG